MVDSSRGSAPTQTGESCCCADWTKSGARCSRRPVSRHSNARGSERMKTYSIAVLPGDGIGPEVIAQAGRVLEAVAQRFELRFALQTLPIGGAGVREAKEPLAPATRAGGSRAGGGG